MTQLAGVLAFALIGTGCQTADRILPLNAKVLRVKGSARYSSDGQNWKPVTVGMVYSKPGCAFQTAMDSRVTLVFFDREGPPQQLSWAELLTHRYISRKAYNLLRLQGDSILRFRTMTEERARCSRKDGLKTIQLELVTGSVFVATKSLGLGDVFEIVTPNGIVNVTEDSNGRRSAFFQVSAEGLIQVTAGQLRVQRKHAEVGLTVCADSQFDVRTGTVVPIPPEHWHHPPNLLPQAAPIPDYWPQWSPRRF